MKLRKDEEPGTLQAPLRRLAGLGMTKIEQRKTAVLDTVDCLRASILITNLPYCPIVEDAFQSGGSAGQASNTILLILPPACPCLLQCSQGAA